MLLLMLFLKYWRHAARITTPFKLGHKSQEEPQCGRCGTNTDDGCFSRQNRLCLDFTAERGWVEASATAPWQITTTILNNSKLRGWNVGSIHPLSHHVRARASTVWIQGVSPGFGLDLSLLGEFYINICTVTTCTQLWEEKSFYFLLGQFMGTFLYQSYLTIFWILLVSNNPSPNQDLTSQTAP